MKLTQQILKAIPKIQDLSLENKKVLVRLDLNVPIKDGKITSMERINACKKTIDHLIKNNCKIVLISHLSRIKSIDDVNSGKKSLAVVADALAQIYPKNKVTFVKDSYDRNLPKMINEMQPTDIMLLENTRYNDVDKSGNVIKLESKNSQELGKFWANLCEVFVNDAFATIHRGHASNAGIMKYINKYCIGFLIQEELEKIVAFNERIEKPKISIVGGAKIADKIILLETLMKNSDQVLIGGGMANTFLAAKGINVGKSLIEKDMIETAKKLLVKYKDKIVLPIDANVGKEFKDEPGTQVGLVDIGTEMMILDIGMKTTKKYVETISNAETIFWNGTTGVNEFKNFENSTKDIAQAIANVTKKGAYSLIGGGDTAGAAVKFADKNDFSWVSTGGGATLAVIQGDDLPGLLKK